jgi:hypothetical protein
MSPKFLAIVQRESFTKLGRNDLKQLEGGLIDLVNDFLSHHEISCFWSDSGSQQSLVRIDAVSPVIYIA